MILDRYRPQPGWFAHDPYGIHGIAHVARVLVWADFITQAVIDEGRDVDIDIVRWAAVLHDVGRLDDDLDPGHGGRSAAWIEANRGLMGEGLDERQLQALQEVCSRHMQADASIPVMTIELICLKDADGLDRVRLGDLNPMYLRTPHAREAIDRARKLMEWTSLRATRDPWENTREISLAMGLWR